MAIVNRTPKLRQLLPVYAVIVAIVYSWTILWFFWRFPSWLYYLKIGEILTIFTYSMATNFMESLIVLLLPVCASILLPRKWFYDQFVARGVTLVIPGLGFLAYIANQFESRTDFPQTFILKITLPVLFLTLLLVFISGRLSFLHKAIETIADRATVFLYLSIPISIISVLIVIIRNLL